VHERSVAGFAVPSAETFRLSAAGRYPMFFRTGSPGLPLRCFDDFTLLVGDRVKLVDEVVDFPFRGGDVALEPAAVRDGRVRCIMRLTGSRWSAVPQFGH